MLRYKDLYDYILGVLYKIKRTNNHDFYSLKEIISALGFNTSPDEIFDIGKYLEAEGYIKTEFTLGDVFIQIKPQGSIYLEEKDGNFLTSVEEFIENENKTIIEIASKLTKETLKSSKRPIVDIMNKLIRYFNETKSMKSSDLHRDARILKLELEKEHIDKEVVLIKLSALADFQPLSSISTELRNHIAHAIDRL